MDDAELDDWFTEEREKLEERFLYAVQENKGPERAKVAFERKYRSLIAKYQREQQAIYDHKRRSEAIQAPITKWKARIAEKQDDLGLWWAARKTAVRKWFFDRKVRRILKDKRDL
jgi:hypothetical protein